MVFSDKRELHSRENKNFLCLRTEEINCAGFSSAYNSSNVSKRQTVVNATSPPLANMKTFPLNWRKLQRQDEERSSQLKDRAQLSYQRFWASVQVTLINLWVLIKSQQAIVIMQTCQSSWSQRSFNSFTNQRLNEVWNHPPKKISRGANWVLTNNQKLEPVNGNKN